MAFDDKFRLGVHAVFTNEEGKILQLKATYGNFAWGLPGGGVEIGETIHQALLRECKEELGVDVKILYLSGIYYHKIYQAQACIFRCQLPVESKIILSKEHSEYQYFDREALSAVQRRRVDDCLFFDGEVKSECF